MPGANLPIDVVQLEPVGHTFVMLGRFPAGFARPVAGGYAAAEEFLVLTGALELEGTTVESGTLCFIPAHHVRSPMRSPRGCTVLAWFSGLPKFQRAGRLTASPVAAVAMVAVEGAQPDARQLRTTEADWKIADSQVLTAAASPVDAVDLTLTWWARVGPGAHAEMLAGPVLVRMGLADGWP